MPSKRETPRAAMNLWSVAALGIGSMVGAGIFALLGQAAVMAGRDIFLSLLLGGIIALLSGHTFGRLAARYPSRGSVIDYLTEAFPGGTVAGTLSLVYLLTLIVTVAVVGKSFGVYTAHTFLADPSRPHVADAFACAMVLALAALNVLGSSAVGRAELLLVSIKLGILLLLIVASVPGFDTQRLTHERSADLTALIASVGLTFFAYAGYGMMANAAASVSRPQTTIPRAIALAITTVILLYLCLALVIMGNLAPEQLARDANTAVAAAAAPVLGKIGVTVVSIGGVLATASASNATLFSILNLVAAFAQKEPLRQNPRKPQPRVPRGFVAAVVSVLALILFFPLDSIAKVASITFLISYLAVFAAHWRLRRAAGGSMALVILGALMMLAVLVGSLVSLGRTQPRALVLVVLMIAGSMAGAWVMRRAMLRHKSAAPRAQDK